MTAERLEHYRYDAESGRLRQRIPDRAYEYDAGGRTTEDGRLRYRYGAHGRLAEITRAATGQRRAAYRYNALGERVKKLSTSVTYYHYDLEGRLLAETDASGQTRAEYLYLGDEPLALSRSGQIYYYHNDHLGTPQKLTDGAGQVVWSARYRAFGEASIGAGYVTQNLRFPGQYYDEESGLHYNYFRYYDPDIGRYLTSDPIGLAGGINTYAYVGGNPLVYTDPSGLNPYTAARGAFWVGGRIGAGINYGIQAATGASLGVLLYEALNDPTEDAQDDATTDEVCPTPNDDDRCEKVKARARSIYARLVNKKIPQYTSGGTRGPDAGHHQSIQELQRGLRKAIGRVRHYCNPLPPELPEWERVANMIFPVLY